MNDAAVNFGAEERDVNDSLLSGPYGDLERFPAYRPGIGFPARSESHIKLMIQQRPSASRIWIELILRAKGVSGSPWSSRYETTPFPKEGRSGRPPGKPGQDGSARRERDLRLEAERGQAVPSPGPARHSRSSQPPDS